MWTPHVTAKGEQLPYAYGWFVEDYRGHRLIYHYGYYDNAYSAVALIVPERQLVFVGLSNGGALSGHNGIDRVEGNALACAVLVDFVDAALPCSALAAANVAKWKARFPLPGRNGIRSARCRYGGSYRRPAGDEARSLSIRAACGGNPRRPLSAHTAGPRPFCDENRQSHHEIPFDKSGHVTRIDVTYRRRRLRLPRFERVNRRLRSGALCLSAPKWISSTLNPHLSLSED
jgi:hypothetical protein